MRYIGGKVCQINLKGQEKKCHKEPVQGKTERTQTPARPSASPRLNRAPANAKFRGQRITRKKKAADRMCAKC